MSILKSKTVTHEFSLQDMAKLIANDLGVDVKAITVNYVIQEVGADFMDRYRGTDTVTKITVTVNELDQTL